MNGVVELAPVTQPGQLPGSAAVVLLAELGPAVGGLLVGGVLVAARPGLADGAAAEIRNSPVKTFLTGAFALLGAVLGLVGASLLAGWPADLVGRLGLGLLWLVGVPLGAYAVGTALTDRVGVANRWLALGVGFAAVALLGGVVSSLPIPSVGLSGLTPSVGLLLVGSPGLGVVLGRAGQRMRGSGGDSSTVPATDGEERA